MFFRLWAARKGGLIYFESRALHEGGLISSTGALRAREGSFLEGALRAKRRGRLTFLKARTRGKAHLSSEGELRAIEGEGSFLFKARRARGGAFLSEGVPRARGGLTSSKGAPRARGGLISSKVAPR